MAVVELKICTAWWYAADEDHIGFMIEREDGTNRMCNVSASTPLGRSSRTTS